MLNHFLGVLAVITPLLVEETWRHVPAAIAARDERPLHRLYPTVPSEWRNSELESDLDVLLRTKYAVHLAQEQARLEKMMARPRESRVVIALPDNDSRDKWSDLFERYVEDLDDFFIVANAKVHLGEYLYEPSLGEDLRWPYQVEFPLVGLDPEQDNATVYVLPSKASKCERCWNYTADVLHEFPDEEQPSWLCHRCLDIVGSSS